MTKEKMMGIVAALGWEKKDTDSAGFTYFETKLKNSLHGRFCAVGEKLVFEGFFNSNGPYQAENEARLSDFEDEPKSNGTLQFKPGRKWRMAR